jgi:signal recognition particle subunit SRP54
MTGQEAVNVALEFDRRLSITGTVLTKMDGDSRGGAALSIRAVTGKPVKFIGTGEKVTALEPFHPDRLVSRILGMGDVLTLIEKSQAVYDETKTKEIAQKFRRQTFTLQDFLDQLRAMKKMGSLGDIAKMIPGLGKLVSANPIEDKKVGRTEAIICSMTPSERAEPKILNASRRVGSRRDQLTVQDVNQLIKQFVHQTVTVRPHAPSAPNEHVKGI